MPEHLFLYGTLIPTLAPPALRPLLGRLVFVGEGTLPGRLHDLGRYPAAIVDPGAKTLIRGRVYRLPERSDDLLARLDAYEECDPINPEKGLYVRCAGEATLSDGMKLTCWVYVYNGDPAGAPVIPEGDYIRYRKEES